MVYAVFNGEIYNYEELWENYASASCSGDCDDSRNISASFGSISPSAGDEYAIQEKRARGTSDRSNSIRTGELKENHDEGQVERYAVSGTTSGNCLNDEKPPEQVGEEDLDVSDGSVLIPLYLRFGARFVRRLKGEFAIAIYDFAKGLVVLATDAFGTKPLHFAVSNVEHEDLQHDSNKRWRLIKILESTRCCCKTNALPFHFHASGFTSYSIGRYRSVKVKRCRIFWKF